jgi:hypothetical protein
MTRKHGLDWFLLLPHWRVVDCFSLKINVNNKYSMTKTVFKYYYSILHYNFAFAGFRGEEGPITTLCKKE